MTSLDGFSMAWAMNRIESAFSKAKSEGRSAFVSYVCAGDPDIDTSLEVCRTLIKSGVDVMELGVPFSDPLADGLTNQLAAQRALEAGTTQADVFQLVRNIRKENDEVPIVFYTYYNLMFSNGLDQYIADAKAAGVDGLLVLDLPPEEAEDHMASCEKHGMKTVFLIAPTTPAARVGFIAKHATGFIYYVSRTGVTGVREDLADDLNEMVGMIREATDKPLVVGFGVSKREQVKTICELADGVVVGSAIVNTIKDNLGDTAAITSRMGELVSDLVAGTKVR
ncbi:tryptophan synthase subunit alpha [Pelagicoccus enzymogenes]|nr:tryptophan synthase subunit alpha [Pelagicoccus enzymogenes]MDQ8198148.1 tryptophan synthase subunit alpha [Pelagicoccus enzymogenes]